MTLARYLDQVTYVAPGSNQQFTNPGVSVYVYLPGTTTQAATKDSSGATLAQPITTDSTGAFGFYLTASAAVDLQFVKTGFQTITKSGVVVMSPDVVSVVTPGNLDVTGYLKVNGGNTLYVYDSGGTKSIRLSHDGTDATVLVSSGKLILSPSTTVKVAVPLYVPTGYNASFGLAYTPGSPAQDDALSFGSTGSQVNARNSNWRIQRSFDNSIRVLVSGDDNVGVRFYAENGGYIQLQHTGTTAALVNSVATGPVLLASADYGGVSGANLELWGGNSGGSSGRTYLDTSALEIRLADGSLTQAVISAATGMRIYDAAGANYARWSHDGANAVIKPSAGSTYWYSADSTKAVIVGNTGINITGLVTLATGQIAFPATQVPSANANTLDDYEEGTWTPVDASVASLSFTSNTGSYVKVGKLVYVQGALVYPATASGAGAAVGGLPFTVALYSGGSISSCPVTTLVKLVLAASSTVIGLDTANDVAVTNAAMTGATLIFSATYMATA